MMTRDFFCANTVKLTLAALISLAFAPIASANPYSSNILSGIIDLPRQAETAAIDGCAKVQTGLTIGGGFMLFTCEKLRPYYPISEQEAVAKRYEQSLQNMGWSYSKPLKDGTEFTKRDAFGCTANLSIRVWKDRAINETVLRKTRDAYRQIVFTANYSGAACEHYYPTVQAMKRQNSANQFVAR